jgi:hypothetical protein
MKRLTRSPLWIILGIGLVAVAGLLLVVALLSPGMAAPAPTTTSGSDPTVTTAETTSETVAQTPATDAPSPEQNSTTEPLAASVNGYTITQSYLSRTVQLNQVLGELSGADTLGKKDTLERMIRSQLILQGVTAVEEPTEEEVENLIGALEQNWGVSDETVVQELQEAGLDRAFLEDTLEQLLMVQASVDSLEQEGHSISDWLQEQEQDADIRIFEDLTHEEETDLSPTAKPTDQARLPTSTPVPEVEVPDVAPDFTLDQAGGGTFTLRDQLEENPVVLVFFEKCG